MPTDANMAGKMPKGFRIILGIFALLTVLCLGVGIFSALSTLFDPPTSAPTCVGGWWDGDSCEYPSQHSTENDD